MTTLADIEKVSREYSKSRETVRKDIIKYQNAVSVLKDKHTPVIEPQLKQIAKLRDKLATLIDENRELFKRPKSKTVNGIKFGLQKQKGKIIIEDEEQTIKLIKKNCKAIEDQLIVTTEKPVKTALQKLSGGLLKKLGVTITTDTNEVVIKAADTDIDKLMDAIADPKINIKELL